MGAGPRSPSRSPQTLKRKGLGLESHELELDEGSDPGEKARRLSEGMDLSVARPRFYVSRCRPVAPGVRVPEGPRPLPVPHRRFPLQSPAPLPEAAYGSSPPAADASLGSTSGSPQGQGRPPAFKPAAPKPPGRSPGPLPPGRLRPITRGAGCRGEGPGHGHPVPAVGTSSSPAPWGFSRPGAACKAPLAASPRDLPGVGPGWVRGQVAPPQLWKHHPLPPSSCFLCPAGTRHSAGPGTLQPKLPPVRHSSELGTRVSSCPVGWHQPRVVTGTRVPPGPCGGKVAGKNDAGA